MLSMTKPTEEKCICAIRLVGVLQTWMLYGVLGCNCWFTEAGPHSFHARQIQVAKSEA